MQQRQPTGLSCVNGYGIVAFMPMGREKPRDYNSNDMHKIHRTFFSHIDSCTISCNRMPLPQAVYPYRYPTATQAIHSSCQRWSIGPCVRN